MRFRSFDECDEMPAPTLSHLPLTQLQGLVLKLILSGRHTRPEIRRGLLAFRYTKNYGAFHEMLSRMVEMGFVARDDSVDGEGGQLYKRPEYSVTAAGQRALIQMAAFYLSDLVVPESRKAA